MKSGSVRQAGFNADLVSRLPLKNKSVLFAVGDVHRAQRSAVARFFAPSALSAYRSTIMDVSERLIDRLTTAGRANVDDLSLELTTAVAASVVGLAPKRGLSRRLSRFFDAKYGGGAGRLQIPLFVTRNTLCLWIVYVMDVRPAIRARRRQPAEDLISHLIEIGASELDILTECVTYATAGISTTREFVTLAACRLLEREQEKERFLDGDQAERALILQEILRREPPVGILSRRTTRDLEIRVGHRPVTLPADALVTIDVREANRTEAGDPEGRTSKHLSFGDGPHRCPGEAIAMLESDIFLVELLSVPRLRLVKSPTVTQNPMVGGYVVRGATIEIERIIDEKDHAYRYAPNGDPRGQHSGDLFERTERCR